MYVLHLQNLTLAKSRYFLGAVPTAGGQQQRPFIIINGGKHCMYRDGGAKQYAQFTLGQQICRLLYHPTDTNQIIINNQLSKHNDRLRESNILIINNNINVTEIE